MNEYLQTIANECPLSTRDMSVIIQGRDTDEINRIFIVELGEYYRDNEDPSSFKYVDRDLNDENILQITKVVREQFFLRIKDSLEESGYKDVFNSDGTPAVNLSNERALAAARDVPLSSILLDGEKFELAMQDKQVVLGVLQKTSLIEFASDTFKSDREIMYAAIKSDFCNLQYASPDLRNDKELVLDTVKVVSGALEYASNELKNDREVVLAAVNKSGYSLGQASYELRSDKEIVLVAIRNTQGAALRQASDELRNDKEFVLKAMSYHAEAFNGASRELKDLCDEKDPVETLTKAINYDNLKKRLAPTSVEQPKQKLKI